MRGEKSPLFFFKEVRYGKGTFNRCALRFVKRHIGMDDSNWN